MNGPWLTLLGLAAIALGYVVAPIVIGVLTRYRGRRAVDCPETRTAADIEIDAGHAARTAFPGPPELRVKQCTRWPERRDCAQACTAHL